MLNDGSMGSMIGSVDADSNLDPREDSEDDSNAEASWETPYLNVGTSSSEEDESPESFLSQQTDEQMKKNSYSSFSEDKAQGLRDAQEEIDNLAIGNNVTNGSAAVADEVWGSVAITCNQDDNTQICLLFQRKLALFKAMQQSPSAWVADTYNAVSHDTAPT